MNDYALKTKGALKCSQLAYDLSQLVNHPSNSTLVALGIVASLGFSSNAAALTSAEAIERVKCSEEKGCNLYPKGFDEKGGNVTVDDANQRIDQGITEGGVVFFIDNQNSSDNEVNNRNYLVDFSNGSATHNGVVILRGQAGRNENFIFGSTDSGNSRWQSLGRNAEVMLNQVIIHQAAISQSYTKNNEYTKLNVKDFWVEGDSGIETYYDINTWESSRDDSSIKIVGPKLHVSNVHVPKNTIFQFTLYGNKVSPDNASDPKHHADIKLDKIDAKQGSMLNLMGVHSFKLNARNPLLAIDLTQYRGGVYYDAISHMEITGTGTKILMGSDLGIKREDYRWTDPFELFGETYDGRDIQDANMLERLVLDDKFNWSNKSIDNRSTICYFATDFMDSEIGDTVLADSVLAMPRFFHNNVFNSEYYELYEPIFYRRERVKSDDNYANPDLQQVNTLAFAPGESQHFYSKKNATMQIHRSLSMEDNDPDNFAPLYFDKVQISLVGDETKGGQFDLNIANMDFSLDSDQDVVVEPIDDILANNRDDEILFGKKVALINANSISIDSNTKVLINGRDLNDSQNKVFDYTANGSKNVTYTVTDNFEISASQDTNSNDIKQSLYYVTGSYLFTMHDTSNLNLDSMGQERFLNLNIASQGAGEKVINVGNSQSQRGSVEFLVKIPESVNVSIDANTTAKQGIVNAFGDKSFEVTLQDSKSYEQGAILDINGFDYATQNGRINLGHNSQIIDSTNSGKTMYLVSGKKDHVVMSLEQGKSAYLNNDVTILNGALKLAYTRDDLPENGSGLQPKPGEHSHLYIGEGSTLTLSGVLNSNPNNRHYMTHLYLGQAQMHVQNHSKLVLGPQLGVHIDNDNINYQYDLDNNENNHTGGGQITVAPQGEVELIFNDGTNSHVYFSNVIDTTHHHFLFSGDDSPLDPNNQVIDRIKININGEIFDNLSLLTPEQIDQLENEMDRILKKQLIDDDVITLQEFSFEIRNDGIFLNAHNLTEEEVHEQFPDLEHSSIIDDYLKIKSGLNDIPGAKESGTYEYMNQAVGKLMDPDLIKRYGSKVLEEVFAEGVDFNTQVASVSRLQSINFFGMEQTGDAIQRRFENLGYGPSFSSPLWNQEAAPEQNLWVDVFRSYHKMDSSLQELHDLQSDIDMYGLVIGCDKLINQDFLLGIALGYNHGESSKDNIKHSGLASEVNGEIDNYLAMIYGIYDINDHLYLSGHGMLGYGNGDFEFTDGFGLKSHGDMSLWSMQLSLQLASPWQLSDNWTLEPFVGIDYNFIKTDHYDVFFGDKKFSSNNTQDINLFAIPIGVSLFADWQLDQDMYFRPNLSLSHTRYFGDSKYSNQASYGPGFSDSFATAALVDEYLNEIELSLHLTKGAFHTSLNGSYGKAEHYKDYSLTLNLDYAF